MASRGPTVLSPSRKRRRGKETAPAPPETGHGSQYFPRNRPACETERLGFSFFDQPCEQLARAMLGQTLVRRLPGAGLPVLRARVVETESYPGGPDEASHSRRGRRTRANAAMFLPPGTLYVYAIYGLHHCLNVSSRGDGSAVLVRSLQPLEGLETMRSLRRNRRAAAAGAAKRLPDRELCNGPGKLCQALSITRALDCADATADGSELWFERGEEAAVAAAAAAAVSARRVGIGSAGEWAERPWRFYIRGNECVSVVDKTAERLGSGVAGTRGAGDEG